MREVIGPLVAALEAGRPVALCRVVATTGSTPVPAGAALLLEADGTRFGTLGGGAVEAEVTRHAADLIGRAGGAEVLRYTLDDDPARADGQTCGGRLTVLVECPLGEAPLAYYRAYGDRLAAGAGLTEAIAVDPAEDAGAPGDCHLFDADRRLVAELIARPESPVPAAAWPSLAESAEVGGWAYIVTAPRVRLVIIGASAVGRAVAELAGRVGFLVWVVDDRPEVVGPDRFPGADRRLVGPIVPTLASLTFDPTTYALVVTRGHGHDRDALGHVAATAAGYVGMIGNRRKVRAVLDELRAAGLPEAALARVAAPVGLDIGSESADEIAVSIVAELIARRNRGPEALAQLRAATGR